MKTVKILSSRSTMDGEERRALALAEALGVVATKARKKARDIIPIACVEVAKRFPAGTDFRKDLTSRAEARQLVEQLQRATKS
jgi:hypothetical protein